MSSQDSNYVLHTYFRSSCSARLRIALNLKGIPYDPIFVNLLKGEQKSDEYAALNPSRSVPRLQKQSGDDVSTIITQSLAALEYLEERHPDKAPLLPSKADLAGRAHVRALANVVACDIQPVTNLRMLVRVAALGGSREDFAIDLMTEGLEAYERLAEKTAGRFSYGDDFTMADACLAPAVWSAMRFRVEMERFPTVQRVFDEISKEDAVVKAHWKNQPDCPAELR